MIQNCSRPRKGVINDCSLFQCSWGRGNPKIYQTQKACVVVEDGLLHDIRNDDWLCSKLLNDWSFSTIESIGMYGDLLSYWIPFFKELSSSWVPSRIVVYLTDSFLNYFFKMINVYVLYPNMIQFWERVSSFKSLNASKIIWGWDLNFTLFRREVWRSHHCQDPHERSFSHWI